MSLEIFVYILLTLVILNIIYTYYVHCQKDIVSLEGFAVDKEALQSLASVLNTGNMNLTNLNVTGKLTSLDVDIKRNLNVTGNTSAKNISVGGVKIEKHPQGYLKIPAPVEINNALTSNHNKPQPGIIVGNVISTTSVEGANRSFQPNIDYGVGVLKNANSYNTPNGTWVMGIGRNYTWGGSWAPQRWFAKKMQTPTGNSLRGGGFDIHAYYANGEFIGPWYKSDGTQKR